ncbi:hypothetical protein CC86DRAFT_160313 [Ophiobolus disseminans]|uniref:Uncharacterized protein n=1 Tax=Ophiobolus disseminans TaxID=1469910 RepID=A0A6A7ACE4_9PLEO|nr:hypothetical protein CC86DRAFT_160313 [Ophiobolus disseminans]
MRLKTLNGAPSSQHLDFSEHCLLALDKCAGFDAVHEDNPASSSAPALNWRCLTNKGTRLRTGWSQPYLPKCGLQLEQAEVSISIPDVEQASTLLEPGTTWNETTIDLGEPATAADDFLEHSLIFHDTLLSSQVAQDTVVDTTISSSSFLTTSFATTASDPSSPNRVDGHTLILHVPPKMAITSIGLFPTSHHLRSIYPQTPTPNTICVLMAPPERREVIVRKGGFKMHLYELSVGDGTMAGFKVTFWLRPPRKDDNEQSNMQQSLFRTLEDVNVGDILLLRNIALTSFRETVYGQSLNPTIARVRTTIDVLMKSNGVSVGRLDGLPAAVHETFMRVKRWARIHVVTADNGPKKRRGSSTRRDKPGKRHLTSSAHDEFLPPDTLEAV